MTKLKYVGKGVGIKGVPAKNLSVEETEKYGGEGKLVASGLYETVAPKKKKKAPAPKKGEGK